ncbi:glutamine amidotransferase [Acinetobacter larvae]|uniref:Glutamine amidotransferase n=1 Tax=Acinetobacter larvae TaxID=1789224 RepID=A0A1B2M454_9GAMM|nr:glutamine amidotransferase [Acinetobacter larvae]AOA59968.1 glutamine amidotransferase [Acinetobacter larvae]
MSQLDCRFPKTIYVIQHIAFEDLGCFEDIFYQLGFRIRYFEAGIDDLSTALQYTGLTIILGGPISVYDTEHFPFLTDELLLLKQRLTQQLPTLGICLGAQLIAKALGANVYAGLHKEIGWHKLTLSTQQPNLLTPLKDLKVLHWHGDSFDLPEHADLLASSEYYPHQAFQIGKQILALQFHLEIDPEHLEKWLIGHYVELQHTGIDIKQLRADNQNYAPQLCDAAAEILQQYLSQLDWQHIPL